MAFTCAHCSTECMSVNALQKHARKFQGGSCCPPMPNEEHSSMSPSDGSLWKVLCLRCSKNFSKRTIEARLVKEHFFFQGRGAWVAPRRDAMASQNQHLANWSRFRLVWERTRNSMQAPPSVAPTDGPAPPPPVLGANTRHQVTRRQWRRRQRRRSILLDSTEP